MCACSVLVAGDGPVLRRFNLYDVENGTARFGCRIAQHGGAASAGCLLWGCRVGTIGHVAEVSVFRPGGVSYLRIAAPDAERSAAFYAAAFGWRTRGRADSFEDATGHIIGHFMTDLPVAGEAGVVPYVYVEDIDQTLAKVTEAGGEVTTEPYPEGDLWVAMTHDPAGNAVGVWQSGGRQQGR